MSSARIEDLVWRAKSIIDELVKLRKEVESTEDPMQRFDKINVMYRKMNELISIINQICMV